jgi:hypothetical protein
MLPSLLFSQPLAFGPERLGLLRSLAQGGLYDFGIRSGRLDIFSLNPMVAGS